MQHEIFGSLDDVEGKFIVIN